MMEISIVARGLAICNLLDSAAHVHKTSKAMTKHLVLLLVGDKGDFDHNIHCIAATLAGNTSHHARLGRE